MAQNARVPANNAPYADLPTISTVLFQAKAEKGLTFDDIAKAISRDEVWVAAAFYGQAKLSAEEMQLLSNFLGVSHADIQSELGEHWWPNRGLGPVPPTDPVIYRLYERCVRHLNRVEPLSMISASNFSVLVYGHAIKAIIHEKFGDGIMSMIDCKVNIERKPDHKGDRVLLTFDGKFLPYAKW